MQNQVPSGPRQRFHVQCPGMKSLDVHEADLDFWDWQALWSQGESRPEHQIQVFKKTADLRAKSRVPSSHFLPLYGTFTVNRGLIQAFPDHRIPHRASLPILSLVPLPVDFLQALITVHTSPCLFLLTKESVNKIWRRGFHELGQGNIYIIIFTNV